MTDLHRAPTHTKIHHGRNIKYFRERMALLQSELAEKLGGEWTQPKISQLEAQEHIDPRQIEEVAPAVNAKAEDILNSEYRLGSNIQNNHDNTSNPCQYNQTGSDTDKIIELYEKLLHLFTTILNDRKNDQGNNQNT